jgi:putative transposase
MNYSEPLICNRYYHLFNHAVGNDNLFLERENYLYFLKKYGQYISPVCHTYAYCLMPNHFHFLIKVKEEEEVSSFYRTLKKGEIKNEKELDFPKFTMQQFSNFFNAYAKAFNIKNNRKGALFIDFVRRKEVRDETCFSKLINYIHHNPIHHGFCKDIYEWEFTSFGSILSEKKTKLEKEQVLEWFGDKNNFLKSHELFPTRWKSKEVEELELI